jgi:hypothetical protein
MTQSQKIINLLDDNNWHCSSQFYAMFISDPRTRICELKKDGFKLENRWCESHSYHEGNPKEWRLLPKQMSLV